MKKPEINPEIALAIYLVTGFGLVAVLSPYSGANLFAKDGFVYNFQSLIAGVLAIGAGAFVYHQTRTNLAMERRRQELKGFASRATLPHLLDQVVRYADGCIETLNGMRRRTLNGMIVRGAEFEPPPPLHFELVERLAEAVETLLDEHAKQAVAEILKDLQSQHALVSSYADRGSESGVHRSGETAANIDAAAWRTATLHRQASNLFKYSRFESEDIPPVTDSDRISSLRLMHYHGLRLEDFMYRRHMPPSRLPSEGGGGE